MDAGKETIVPGQPAQQAAVVLKVFPVFRRPSRDMGERVKAVMAAWRIEAE